MGELIDSDDEVNQGDFEEQSTSSYGAGPADRSFMDSDEERGIIHKYKQTKEAKINNSFTGPYPVDPCDFKHKDKGPNYQFE